MALNVPVFFTRLGSSVVFVAVMFTGLLWNDWSFFVLVCLIQALCLRDYFRLMPQIDKDSYLPKWLPVVMQAGSILWLAGLFALNYYTQNQANDYTITHVSTQSMTFNVKDPHAFYAHSFKSALYAYAVFFIITLLLVTVLSKKTALPAFMQSVVGIVYIVVPVTLLMLLNEGMHYIPIIMIVMIWTNDTMAYLAGSFFGKTPFSPISPKKTWEGIIGGALLTVFGGVIFGSYSASLLHLGAGSTPQNMLVFGIMGAIVAVAATLGDLLESKLKRMAGVKDSGTLMPGHGGALDRFDSLLIVTPFIYCAYCLVKLFY